MVSGTIGVRVTGCSTQKAPASLRMLSKVYPVIVRSYRYQYAAREECPRRIVWEAMSYTRGCIMAHWTQDARQSIAGKPVTRPPLNP